MTPRPRKASPRRPSRSREEGSRRPSRARRVGAAAEDLPSRPWTRLLPLLIPIVVALAFAPALRAGFVNFDDDRLFLRNPNLRAPWPAAVQWAFSTMYMGHYQPLSWLSSAIDARISGTDPWSYHLTNVLLHATSAVLVYLVAARLLALAAGSHPLTRVAAAFASLFWAVHPLRVESVAWATERRDVLSGAFLAFSLLAYLQAVRAGAPRLASQRWYSASIAAFACSLLSKASGMTFAGCLLALDVYPLRRLSGRPRSWLALETRPVWLQKVPYALLGSAAAVVAWFAQASTPGTMASVAEWGVAARAWQVLYGVGFYLQKTAWPLRLAVLYERPQELDAFAPQYWPALLVAVVAVMATCMLVRRAPAIPVAFTCYVLMLAPVSGVAQSGPQLVADRYSYLSGIALAVLAAGGLLLLWRRVDGRRARIASMLAAGSVLVLLASVTWLQCVVWRDSLALWEHAFASGAESAIARVNYGQALREAGRNDEAGEAYRAAVRQRPDNGGAWYNLANLLKTQKRYDEAEAAYLQAIRYLVPSHDAHLNLGNLYTERGRRTDAVRQYRLAVQEVERWGLRVPEPYLALGLALVDVGRAEEARRPLEVASRYAATRPQALDELRRLDSGK